MVIITTKYYATILLCYLLLLLNTNSTINTMYCITFSTKLQNTKSNSNQYENFSNLGMFHSFSAGIRYSLNLHGLNQLETTSAFRWAYFCRHVFLKTLKCFRNFMGFHAITYR